MDLDEGSSNLFPMDPLVQHSLGGHLLSHISSFVDNSVYHSRFFYVPGSLALWEALSCVSKFAGAILFQFASGSNSHINDTLSDNSHVSNNGSCKSSVQVKHISSIQHNVKAFCYDYRSKGESVIPVIFGKISSFTVGQLGKQAEQLQSFPLLSLAAALIPPLDNLSPNVLAIPLENCVMDTRLCMDQSPCDVEHRSCQSFPNSDWTTHAVEAKTGIEFPTILDNILAGENNSSFSSEILVGTGSRTMTIIRIKSLRVYAFGFYVHPYDVCEKLGPKYASIPIGELNKHNNFYEDLLREDINMTVRLVISCNGIRINAVKDSFEKSLRARLRKTNPETDYCCLTTFDSLFSQDISLRPGTTIDFRRTADGHLITEIEGNQIGAVHSKDLCRAFFDMYIGDVPVCQQTKEEIGKNVWSIVRRC